VDPEEAFVASLASCHMLWFLNLASRAGLVVDAYEDDPVAVMSKAEDGLPWVSRVTLRPRVTFQPGKAADDAKLAGLHEESHRRCFIARSVKTDITVEPQA
jgi:organic hydroperoxide reductase OsmC/OhrA